MPYSINEKIWQHVTKQFDVSNLMFARMLLTESILDIGTLVAM